MVLCCLACFEVSENWAVAKSRHIRALLPSSMQTPKEMEMDVAGRRQAAAFLDLLLRIQLYSKGKVQHF